MQTVRENPAFTDSEGRVVTNGVSISTHTEPGEVELGEPGPAHHHTPGGPLHGEAAEVLRQ